MKLHDFEVARGVRQSRSAAAALNTAEEPGIRVVSIDAQQDALGLTLLRQDGAIAASLTDFRLIARLARIDAPDALLLDLQRDAQNLLSPSSGTGADQADRFAVATRFCAFGSRLFSSLLPESIRSFLRESPACTVSLQISADLAPLPWELAFDGESFFGEKFRLSRQIVADERVPLRHRSLQGQGALRVLALAGGTESAAQSLIARLRIMDGITVSGANAFDLRRDDLLGLIGTSEVVHYMGPVDGRSVAGGVGWSRTAEPLDLRAIASLPNPPQLLISQNTAVAGSVAPRGNQALAMGACRLGLSVLICESAAEADDCLELLLTTYRQLTLGAALAEAVRMARSQLRQRAGIATLARMQTEFYGDGRLVIFARDRQPRGEDNVRQVTIMSFDIVESTRLLGVLGAERYSELLAEFHRRSAQILAACGGARDDPKGSDGTMCYFGFPIAREDAASQAVRAGLELIDAVHALGLGVRVGISTGQVVVRNGQPVGSAIHFAARLQGIAAPGTLVVSDSTRRIVKDRYRFQQLEQVPVLKGFDQPGRVYRALGPAPDSPGTPDAIVVPPMTPFVGRRQELLALEQHWTAAKAGALRLVRIVGDAGIGKSRLVREFRRSLVDKGYEVFECRCTPDHINSAFHPVMEWLRKQLRILEGDPPGVTLERMRDFVAPAGIDGAVALLADLLAVPLEARHVVLDHPAEQRRKLTLDVLVALARLRLQSFPACLIVEDTHWIDPSTGEFLSRLAADARALPLLLVVTARSDAEVKWHPRCAVHETELRNLSPESSRMLVLSACGDVRLPREVVHFLAARADGVPLFIEESTKMFVETNAGLTPDAMSVAMHAVPVPILDLLATRLDRLGAAKHIAQIAGAIGREFPLALLEAVLTHESSPFPPHDLAAHLATLLRSGILTLLGEGDDARYAFRHALMRDAAYGSLLESERTRLHRVIALVSTKFRGLAETQPELLALHFANAGADSEALTYWERAARRSAHVESISHVSNALKVVARLPHDGKRDRDELRLQLFLATRLIATEGYGADRVERVYARAMELTNAIGDEAAQMKVLLGLEGYHFMRGDFGRAQEIAVDAGTRAQHSADAIHRVQSKWAVANILMHQGEMEAAVRQMDECRAEYDRIAHRPGAVQDPGVMCLCYSAWGLWQLGFADQALERAFAVVARAKELNHKFSIGEAYGFRAAVQHFRGENEAALESAERAIEVCEESGFPVWLAHARLMHGRVVAELVDNATGIDEMRQAYDQWAATGAVATTPFYLALRAEGLALGGRPEEGLALLEQALAIVNRNGERYYEAEIRRLFGQLILQSAARAGLDRSAEAESWLLGAQDCAQSRKLKSLTLRCAISLAELWLAQGRHPKAIAVLEPAYQSIGEGAGTRDLVRARGLLATVRQERTQH
ncbi:MAG TPA: AAA family ATPase [Burkholderiaceae bacterium]|nr:AAA family ATPase [Burkholderiaceae bacterium]